MMTASVSSTWLWIPKTWVVLYPVVTLLSLLIGVLVDPAFYSVATLVFVPLGLVPLTFKNLVGGACSLRFRVCGLVKGVLAGFIFLVLSISADLAVWTSAMFMVGWSPLLQTQFVLNVYWVWFFSGVLGGMGARIVEVRHGGARPDCSATVSVVTQG